MEHAQKPHPTIKIPPNKQIDNRWNQLKINNSFSPRSNFGFTAQGNIAYLHGGYSIDKGKLDDLYKCRFEQDQHREWQLLPQKGSQKPGKLQNHSLVNYLHFLICFGGQASILQNNSKIFKYSLKTNVWNSVIVKAQGILKDQIKQYLMRDSQLCFIVGHKMHVFGGYQAHLGDYTNTMLQFDLGKLQKQNIITMKIVENKALCPSPRGNFGYCFDSQLIYIFGGTNSKINFDDFWAYDLQTETWSEIKHSEPSAYWPQKRKGCVMGYHEETGNIFMFGGMKEITKEQNDVSIYIPSQKQWVKIHSTTNSLYEASPTLKNHAEESPSILQANRKKALNQQFSLGVFAVNNRKKIQQNTLPNFDRRAYKTQISINHDEKPENQTNLYFSKKKSVVQEKRHRQFLIRKKKLLSDIIKGNDTQSKRPFSPVTQSLNYSINQIGQQTIKPNIEDNPLNLPKVIYDRDKNLIVGKKPCARDGHAGFTFKEHIYIIGGDRHNISFNDVYIFKMQKGIESITYYKK